MTRKEQKNLIIKMMIEGHVLKHSNGYVGFTDIVSKTYVHSLMKIDGKNSRIKCEKEALDELIEEGKVEFDKKVEEFNDVIDTYKLKDFDNCIRNPEAKQEQSVIDFLMAQRQEILDDERMTYKTATIFINAPLALHQACQASKLHLIEHALCLPITQIPLKNDKSFQLP